jgi:hypothetical protein
MSGMGRQHNQGDLPGRRQVASKGVIIVIDLTEERVILAEPDDFGRFSVAIEGDGSDEELAAIVGESRLGRMADDGAHVVVDPVSLRALAGPSATPAWDEGFAAMCTYAAGKGWVEADGGILAHVERKDGPE